MTLFRSPFFHFWTHKDLCLSLRRLHYVPDICSSSNVYLLALFLAIKLQFSSIKSVFPLHSIYFSRSDFISDSRDLWSRLGWLKHNFFSFLLQWLVHGWPHHPNRNNKTQYEFCWIYWDSNMGLQYLVALLPLQNLWNWNQQYISQSWVMKQYSIYQWVWTTETSRAWTLQWFEPSLFP